MKRIFSILILSICSLVSERTVVESVSAQNFATPRTSEQNGNVAEVLPETFSRSTEWNDGENFDAWNCDDPNDPIRRRILDAATRSYSNWPTPSPLRSERLFSSQICRLEGKYLDFYSDMPLDASIQEFPAIADAAVVELCRYFQIDENELADWRIEAFLIKDKANFRPLGVLDRVPDFPHGYSAGRRIFAMDHKIEYYNRFLMIHELVHSFMYRIFGDLNPRWFSEGMAEYLGLHSWDGRTLRLGIVPDDEEQVEGFGRLRSIRERIQEDRVPSIQTILNFKPNDFNQVETYAWSWAFVLFLDRSPKYRAIRRKTAFYMAFPDANRQFVELIGDDWEQLENDWKSFLACFDYSYDFEFVDWNSTQGTPLDDDSSVEFDVAADRNWQNSGVWVEKGTEYRLEATGRFQVAHPRKTIACEPNGVTFDYYSGRPWGRLLFVVVPEIDQNIKFDDYYQNRFNEIKKLYATSKRNDPDYQNNQTNQNVPPLVSNNFPPQTKTSLRPNDSLNPRTPESPFFWNDAISFSSNNIKFVPQISGTLFFRINVPVSSLPQNAGTSRVSIRKIE